MFGWHEMKWFYKPIGTAFLIGLLLCLYGVASGNAQTTYTTINAGKDSSVYNANGVYLTARNAVGGVLQPTHEVGLRASIYSIYRLFMYFVIPPLYNNTIVADSLCVHGDVDSSVTDFNVDILLASESKSVYADNDFSHFSGWQASGSYTGTVLNNTWNSSSYVAGYNKLVLNAAGTAAVTAAANDTLWVVLLSSKDYNATQPTTSEYINFSGNETAYRPYLAITYIASTGTIRSLLNPTYLYNNGDSVPITRP